MAQLTPYGDGIFQLHGMTKGITLFDDGLVASTSTSAQPELPNLLLSKIRLGWKEEALEVRTNNAIQHMAQFIPAYHTAVKGGKALFGAQQIPGSDPVLRAADVTFEQNNYARVEIVKASSTLLPHKRYCIIGLISNRNKMSSCNTLLPFIGAKKMSSNMQYN